jgi:hypothetical protein
MTVLPLPARVTSVTTHPDGRRIESVMVLGRREPGVYRVEIVAPERTYRASLTLAQAMKLDLAVSLGPVE